MRAWLVTLFGMVLASTSCAAQPVSLQSIPYSVQVPQNSTQAPPETDSQSVPSTELWSEPVLTPAQVDAEAAKLSAALKREVPHLSPRTPERDVAWIGRAKAAMAASGEQQPLDRPQLMVVVDRNPAVQAMAIILARPDGPWEVIGGTRVSTGQLGRFDYYVTPVGVFRHTDSILDYRAEGTFNENHIRGLGLKGMRVWDFGWQTAGKGWRADREQGPMRLLMHATDPANLEYRIGRPASKGCIRVPAAVNRFMDHHGVLDADYERAAKVDPMFRALLPRDRVPTPLAGNALVVIDSAITGQAQAVAAAHPAPSGNLVKVNSSDR
jgi:hypothetical protein